MGPRCPTSRYAGGIDATESKYAHGAGKTDGIPHSIEPTSSPLPWCREDRAHEDCRYAAVSCPNDFLVRVRRSRGPELRPARSDVGWVVHAIGPDGSSKRFIAVDDEPRAHLSRDLAQDSRPVGSLVHRTTLVA